MKLSDLGEFGLIERLVRGAVARPDGLLVGPGDDCAVLRPAQGFATVVTADMFIEGVHFERGLGTLRQAGRRALARSMSDVAAMGGRPREAVVAVAVPEGWAVEELEEFFDGLKARGARHGVNLAGGDVSRTSGPLAAAVTVLGEVEEAQVMLRSGARPGDVLAVTGPLGLAAAGLDALRLDAGAAGPHVDRFLDPEPRVAEGRFLASTGAVRAAIDLSDGLASDLRRVCERSGVGARVRAAGLPLGGGASLELALRRGEDYEILAALDAARYADVAAEFGARFGRPLAAVGEIAAGPALVLVFEDGSEEPLGCGHDHFPTEQS